MKNLTQIIIFLSILLLIAFSCKDKPELPITGNKIEIGHTVINASSYYGAQVTTTVINIGGNTINQHGHCWSLNQNPTIADSKTSIGSMSQAGNFSSDLSNLTPNSTYNIRPYITYSNGTLYGSQVSITTSKTGKPIVTTKDITDITLYTATGGGEVTQDSGLAVTQRGIVWNSIQNPTLETNNGLSSDGSGTGNYMSHLLELSEAITYYVRAYATNESGTSYGIQVSFSTLRLNPPTVSTTEATEITINSAISGGNVTADGNSYITERGVVWSTNKNPSIDINDGITNDGSGIGIYTSQLTNLTSNTNYYVRAYATNVHSTAYGAEEEFVTIPQCGEYTINYGNQIYHTVLIGKQCWMKENLNIGIIINQSIGMTDNNVIEKYCPSNNQFFCNEGGGLYNWYEMLNYVIGDGQGICPEGWHIPSNEDWILLAGTVDSYYDANDKIWSRLFTFNGFDAGKNLRSKTGWKNNGTDLYGFSALPSIKEGWKASFATWWTSSYSYDDIRSYQFSVYEDRDEIFIHDNLARGGATTVRCLKNY